MSGRDSKKRSKKLPKTAIERVKGPEELAMERAIETTVSEIHMGQYPIFCITTQKRTDTRMMYREQIKVDGVEITKEWNIRIAADYGWPGEHEAGVWRAIQHIVELRAKADQLTNPVQTTLEEIRDHMSSKSKGGQQRKAIVRSLHCLASTNLETNYWYDKAQNNYDSAQFALIADLKLSQRKLPSGKQIIDKVYVGFGPELFRNLQSRHVRPLDKGFMDERLDLWLSKRLYELLGPKFYGLRKKGIPYRTRYSRLCGLLGAKRQQYLSLAKRILGRAHQELQQHGFLARIEWYPMLKDKHDWVVHYWPGPRAKAEWKKAHWWKDFEIREALYIEELPDTGPDPIYVEEPPDESAIVAQVATDQPPELPTDYPRQLPLLVEEPPPLLIHTAGARRARPQPQARVKRALDPAAPVPNLEPMPSPPLAPARELDPYAKAAIEAFERATGKSRRLAHLTEAEQRRLEQWQQCGVKSIDIEQGTRAALTKQAEQAEQAGLSGKRPREIVSLSYVNGYVIDAASERQQLELAAAEALEHARAAQSPELKAAEARLQDQLCQYVSSKAIYRSFFAELLLAELGPERAVLLAPDPDMVPIIASRKDLLGKLLGTQIELYSVVEWAEHLKQKAKARLAAPDLRPRGDQAAS